MQIDRTSGFIHDNRIKEHTKQDFATIEISSRTFLNKIFVPLEKENNVLAFKWK